MAAQFFSATVTTAGAPQNLGASATPIGPVVSSRGTTSGQGSVEILGSSVVLQAAPGNAAGKYVYVGGPTMDVAAKTGIGMALAPGEFSQPIQLSNGGVRLTDLWIDTDGADGAMSVFVSVAG